MRVHDGGGDWHGKFLITYTFLLTFPPPDRNFYTSPFFVIPRARSQPEPMNLIRPRITALRILIKPRLFLPPDKKASRVNITRGREKSNRSIHPGIRGRIFHPLGDHASDARVIQVNGGFLLPEPNIPNS